MGDMVPDDVLDSIFASAAAGKKNAIRVSVTVGADGKPASKLTATALPRIPEQKGQFMIMTHEYVAELEKRYAHGDAGRVHFFLLKCIERKTGLIHFSTQQQIADAMGVDKSLVSRGMKELVAEDIVRRLRYLNANVFIMQPGCNKGRKRAKKYWDMAGAAQAVTEQTFADEKTRAKVKALIAKGLTRDEAIWEITGGDGDEQNRLHALCSDLADPHGDAEREAQWAEREAA